MGRDFIESFADGIRERIDRVRSAIGAVAQAIRDRLPSSPAKEGPLSDLDQTGPGLIDEFAWGIEASTPRVSRAAAGASGTASDAAFAASRDQTPQIFLDERRVDDNQIRYRRGRISQRGR